MKKIFATIVGFMVSVTSVEAQDCNVHMMIMPMEQVSEVPVEAIDMLNSHLARAVTASPTGVTADPNYDQFYIGGKFSHIYQDIVPGPPKQDVMHTTLTLYVGDMINNKIYASTSFELKGVGTSEQRCYVNALRALNGKNQKLVDFIENARNKILSYYDSNYPSILKQAKTALGVRKYEEAAYFASSIPTCCKGYSEAHDILLEAASLHINETSQKLLQAAKAEWAAHPDATGAENAMAYLTQIPSYASCWPQAQLLYKEIANKVQRNWDFENITKYEDSIAIEKEKIDAARQIGVAFGNGQKANNTNLILQH